MKKTTIAIISLLLAVFMIAGCTPAGEKNNASDNAGGTTTPSGDESKDPSNELLEKVIFSSEHYKINGKMTKYLYMYLLSVYYQYYGQYAPYYVTAETVKGEATELLSLCEAAYAAGKGELDADALTEISDAVTSMEKSFKENGYETLEAYYGDGVDASAVVEAMKLQYIAVHFSDEKKTETYESLKNDKDGLLKYFNEHKNLLFGTCYAVNIEDETYFARLSAAKTREEMKAIADEYAAEKKLDIDEIAVEKAINYPELKEGEELNSVEKWFFDGKRARGDIFADTEEKIVYFIILPAVKREELLRNAGHILIIPEGDTEEYKAAAKAKAEAILAEYLAGDKTKESFETLAKANTKDGNVFYDDIYIGQMVEPFNDWVYDESRKTGDTDIVETEYGYHIMYFVSVGELKNYEYIAISEMYEEAMNEWQKGIAASYSATTDEEALKSILED